MEKPELILAHPQNIQDAEWSFKRLVGIHEKVGWQKNNNS